MHQQLFRWFAAIYVGLSSDHYVAQLLQKTEH
jgi:hypothetical protein